MNERQIVDLLAREYVEEFGGSVHPTPLWVEATGHAASGQPFGLVGDAITTFPPVVPCTDDPWLWISITGCNIVNTPPSFDSLTPDKQAAWRFTMKRTGFKLGDMVAQSLDNDIPFGGGWVPMKILFARAGHPFILPWPVLFHPTDAFQSEVANLTNTQFAMFPMTLFGYRFQRRGA